MNHQPMFRALTLAGLLLVLLCPDSQVHAQWSTDPNVNNPICTTPGRYRTNLLMASDGAGGAFLTWTGNTSLSSFPVLSLDVYAQRIDSSGLLPWGGGESVVANNRLDQRFVSITSDDSGGACIVWGTRPLLPPLISSLVFGQRMGANGTELWSVGGEFVTALSDLDVLYDTPATVADGAGGAIIAYPSTSRVDVARIKRSGTVQFDVAIWTGQASQRSLAITSDGAGGAIVAWFDTGLNLYAQRIDASGVVQWSTNGVAILSGGSARFNPPTIVGDGAAGAIIIWVDNRTTYGIYTQHVDSVGTVQWTTNGVPVIIGASLRQGDPPVLVSDNAGGAIIAWQDTSVGVRAQRVNNTGVLQWDSSGVAVAPTPNFGPGSSYPVVSTDGAGGAIIAWSDARNGASNTDVYAQRVDASGVAQWAANGVAISTATGNQSSPAIISNGAGGAIIAWLDKRSSPPFQVAYVYGQRVNANGQLGGTTDAADKNPGTPGAFQLNQSYPNPFNPTTTFTFSIPHTSNVRLNVYNTIGQEVATIVNETLSAGDYSRTFNAATLASGTYFYRLTAGEYSETKRMLLLK